MKQETPETVHTHTHTHTYLEDIKHKNHSIIILILICVIIICLPKLVKILMDSYSARTYCLSIFLPIIAISMFNSTSTIIFKRKFGEMLPISFMMIMLVCYFSQLVFKTFIVGYVILGTYSSVSIIYLIIKKFDRKYIDNIFSIGFYVFLIFYIFFNIIYFKKYFGAYDELMHWGPMVKEMLRLDRFYTDNLSTLMYHKDYPPLISLFEMIWCKVATTYSEMNVTIALHILMISFAITPIVERFNKNIKNVKNIFKASIIGGIITLAILYTDVYHTYATIYLDILLPLIFVYGMYIVLTEKNIVYSYVGILLSCITMIMAKQSGIAFMAIVVLTYIMTVLLNKENRNTNNKILIYVCLVITLIALPLLINKSWSRYISQFDIYQQFKLSDIKVQEVQDILKGNDYRKDVIKKFLNSLIEVKLSNGILSVTYLSGTVLIFLLLFLICKYNKDFRKKGIILAISFLIGTIGYMAMMLLLYLFSFSKTEAMQLASFNRYMSSYFLGELMLLVLIGIVTFYKDINKISISKLLIAFAISIILLDGTTLKEIAPYVLIRERRYKAVEQLGNYIMNNTEENSKILIISKQKGHLQLYTHYFTEGRYFALSWKDYLSGDYENNDIANQMFNELKMQDYIFLVDTSDKFNEQYNKYLEDGKNIEKSGLYKVTYNDNKLVLSKK